MSELEYDGEYIPDKTLDEIKSKYEKLDVEGSSEKENIEDEQREGLLEFDPEDVIITYNGAQIVDFASDLEIVAHKIHSYLEEEFNKMYPIKKEILLLRQ